MELKDYINILKRWAWFLSLSTVLGIGCGYLLSQLLTPTYQATTKILVSKDVLDQNSQFAAMNTQQLIDTYVQLLTSARVVDEVSRRLNYPIDLRNIGQVQQVRGTPVIQITIEDGKPQQAAAIANMLVEVLIDQNTQASGYTSTEEGLNNQITEVEDKISALSTQYNQISAEVLQSQLKQVDDQITSIQKQILTLNQEINQLASLPSPNEEQGRQLVDKQVQLAQLQSVLVQYQQVRINLQFVGRPVLVSGESIFDLRLQQIQSSLDHYQNIYLDLLDNLQTVQLARLRNPTTIYQIEKATPPTDPVRPRPVVYTLLAGIVGLVFAIGVIFVIEYMDTTLKTPQDVEQALDFPALGDIANREPVSEAKNGLPIARQLHEQTTEALYGLRTNLEFAFVHHPLKTLLLLSIDAPLQSKSSLATDLAISYAETGKKVILLDADVRHPSVHNYFGLTNEKGFHQLLTGELDVEAVGRQVDGMTVITSGTACPGEYRLFSSGNITQVLNKLKKHADLVIIDSPSPDVADSLVLSSKVDGVLLIVQPRITHVNQARQTVEQLHRVGATIIGTVLYRVPRNLTALYKKYLDRRSS